MTQSSTPAPSLKIRIRVDTTPLSDAAPATLDMRRVFVALGAVALILFAAFGIRSLMKNQSPGQMLASNAEVMAPAVAPLPSETTATAPPAPLAASAPRMTTPGTASESTSSPIPTNRIVRAVLTDIVYKQQTVLKLTGDLPAAAVTKRFYFFTEVQDVTTRRLTHRWEYRGKTVAQIPFLPSGKNWTGSSNKQIPTHMQGAWRAVLVDERGAELTSVAFNYGRELTATRN